VSEFVDTNIFVRVLTGDDPQKAERSLALFQRAQRGETTLVTSESVIAEVAYVLSSRSLYNVPRSTIAIALQSLIADAGFQIEHKESILRALELWQTANLDFVDCVAVEYVRRSNLAGIYSYDRGFDRIPGILRLEP
jgi:predicted nucleic acid-binding protein